MTDLYSIPGSADKAAKSLSYNHEANVLFEAEIAYSRGEIDKVYDRANYLLSKHSGFYAIISAGMLLALCALWHGDLSLWRRAKVHIAEAPARDDTDRDLMTLALCAVDSMLYDTESFPAWFKIGNFEKIPKDSLPAVKIYYAKYLYAVAFSVATGQAEREGVLGLSIMRMLPFTIEPMISQAMADESIICEIYLRMICATAYHNAGNDTDAIRHLDRAIELAIPDRIYDLLAEYSRVLDTLLESTLARVSEKALSEITKLHKIYNEGWSALGSIVRGRHIINTLSKKEREVAKLAAFGLSNQEIADKLSMTVPIVKQAIRIVSEKSGLSRADFAAIL
jgi:tetratricopeptide (TPR) repeat protein